MGVLVDVTAHLVLKVDDTENIQVISDLLTKITARKFCLGFGVPKLTERELAIAKDMLEKIKEHGFDNPELNQIINKPRKKDEENQNLR